MTETVGILEIRCTKAAIFHSEMLLIFPTSYSFVAVPVLALTTKRCIMV